ncbi:deoxyribose-phosphate aldolase [Desulfofalx alkaliphila]|uniref:deoxyribose-phosphate aldolase n=1 Tax=Desulfofalx alkaliphila TaxID=105483 RepID=UPI0004E25D48|nr:deoxyribose-phosphate aldolase [Desulfofalx alkaliphila]
MKTKKQLAAMIDHTLLRPTATKDDIIMLCKEAADYSFASVCVNPCHVPLAVEQLQGTDIAVCTVIGFPLGCSTTAAKTFEAKDAVSNGAQELDMVINIGALKAGKQEIVLEDIKAVVAAAQVINPSVIIKVIIETCYLSKDEKITACQLARRAGAHYVKNSTGFGSGGATVEDVWLMRKTVGPHLGVKAAGGIKTASQALALIEAGATRIGASAGIAIVNEMAGEEY